MGHFLRNHYDAVVIGSGISGACAARELARYGISAALLEKGSDFCPAATRGNSATVHSGHDATYGTNKARYNVLGNAMYGTLCEELSVPFNRNGTIIMALTETDLSTLERLKKNAEKNGVPGVEILSPDGLARVEGLPFGTGVRAGLYAPSGGMVCPYSLVFALCENAAANGVHFYKNAEVTAIARADGRFRIETPRGVLTADAIFNCAGTHADEISRMAGAEEFLIIPRKGDHLVLDRKVGKYTRTTLAQTPTPLPGGGHTKGMGVQPSVDGTVLLGCDARDVADKDDASTTVEGKEAILSYFRGIWKDLPLSGIWPTLPENLVISAYSGLRPHPECDDFILGESRLVHGFFQMAGIESPGLTAAPAIAVDLAAEAAESMGWAKRSDFNPIRSVPKPFREMSDAERAEAIRRDPAWGRLICRCELVTEAEIRSAVRGPAFCPELGADSVSAVKMRTRAGMGRCQGGFCGPDVAAILSEELGIPMTAVRWSGPGSELLVRPIGVTEEETGNE